MLGYISYSWLLYQRTGRTAVTIAYRGKDMGETIRIETTRCCGCGLCADVCPDEHIQIHGEIAVLVGGRCMACGHCASICPEQCIAVTGVHTKLGFQTFEELEGVVQPGETGCEKLVQLMRSRRSCRQYSKKGVADALLEDIVRAGITAPSGTNSQGWGFVIAGDRFQVEHMGRLTGDYYRSLNEMAANPLLRFTAKIFAGDALGMYYRKYHDVIKDALERWEKKGEDLLFHGATAVIMVTADEKASCGAEDALLATQNMILAAHGMGLGSCLIGFVVEAVKRDKRLKRKLGIKDTERLCSVIALGYPSLRFVRAAPRKEPVIRYTCL